MVYSIIDDAQHGLDDRHSNTTGFPTLAPELVYEIVSYYKTMRYPYTSNEVPIPSNVLEGWRVLKALSETCKALRVKCRPLLWQNVVCAAGYRRVDTSKRSGKKTGGRTLSLEGRIERELDAVTGLLSGRTGIGDLAQYVQSFTITVPPKTSEETIFSLAECLTKLTNLQTLQIIGPTSPLVGRIFTSTSTSTSFSSSSSSISNISAYGYHPRPSFPSTSASSSPPSSSSSLSSSSSSSSSNSNRDKRTDLLPPKPFESRPQDRDRLLPVHCPSLKTLLLDSTTYEIIPCFPNLVRLYCSFHTFYQRQGSNESLSASRVYSSPSTGSLWDSSSGEPEPEPEPEPEEPEHEPEPLGLPWHFNVHDRLASTLSEGMLRRLADVGDVEEEVDEDEEDEEEQEEEEGEEEEQVGSSSNTGTTRPSELVPPILSDFDSGLPQFRFPIPNTLSVSPFGANPNTNSSTLPFPTPSPTSPFFGANPNTNSTLPVAPPPPPVSMSVPATMLGTDFNPPSNSTLSFPFSYPHPHPHPFHPTAVPPIQPSPLESIMEPGSSSSVASVPPTPTPAPAPTTATDPIQVGGTLPNPTVLHPIDPVLLDPVNPLEDILNLNPGLGPGLGLGLVGAVGDSRDRDRDSGRDREEERRMRDVQWKIIECIRAREGGGTTGGTGGTGGGWSLEVFEMGGSGVEEDGEMWVVLDDEGGEDEGGGGGGGGGGGDGRGGGEGGEGRDEEGDGVEEEGKKKKNMYPLEGSLIRAIVETMPNLRNFPKIHVHPETPVSSVSYTFHSLPYLSSFYINPSEPLDPRTIEFIAACTSVMGEVAGENGGTSTIPGTSASASASAGVSMIGSRNTSRNTSSMGKRRKNMELRMQMGNREGALPILGCI
ncbi:hypothetical protein K435DRAFT_966636 [Dendrothele bispora CBS 962.96]|uniref:Uncharacterized protein n=1 Tax=Dendrothele bispora (strain CBS 962.96) TaxID=1314807 RepID=A0A4S8LZ29_DENBC|nr:hypothetical protein K435DRAFT_966636 [Dendrothele bispora CBS 962.96]